MKRVLLLSTLIPFLLVCCKPYKLDPSLFAAPPCVKVVADGKYQWLKAFNVTTSGTINGANADTLSWSGTLTMQGDTVVLLSAVTKNTSTYMFFDTTGTSKSHTLAFNYDGAHTVNFGKFQYTMTGTQDTCSWPHVFDYELSGSHGDTTLHMSVVKSQPYQ